MEDSNVLTTQVLNEAQNTAETLLSSVFNNLISLPDKSQKEQGSRLFFPNGIEVIYLKVDGNITATLHGSVVIEIAGNKTVSGSTSITSQETNQSIKGYPNWDQCGTDLNWSANYGMDNWNSHGDALQKKASGDESGGFIALCAIQGHNGNAVNNYALCRQASMEKFWSLAVGLWHADGPTGC